MTAAPIEEPDVDHTRWVQISPDLFLISAVSGRILWASPSWTDLLGWSLDELRELGYWQLIHPEDIERTSAAVAEWKRNGRRGGDGFRNRYRCKGGGYKTLEWYGQGAARSPDGEPVTYNVARDVSPLAAALEQERRTNALLGEAAHLTEHQLKSGISASSRWLDVALEELDAGDLAEARECVASAQFRALATHDTLRAMTRYFDAATRRELRVRTWSLSEIVAEALRLIDPPVDVEVQDGDIDCDFEFVAQALSALIDNAHTHGAPPINVSLDDEGIVFDDSGVGIEEGDRRRALELGERLSAAAPGDGFGLALVVRVAELHDGRVELSAAPGGGLRVKLQLPSSPPTRFG